MTTDLAQFHQLFFEEARDHLAAMEQLLLAIDTSAPDAEELNAIFRAAHSVKGGAATFGFPDIAGFTHKLENILDGIRKGERPLRADMVDVFLACGDALLGMVKFHQSGEAVDPAHIDNLTQRLAAFEGPSPLVPPARNAKAKESSPSTRHSVVAKEDQDFGLFTSETAAEDETFGLFASDPAAEDEGFGLFHDDPAAEDASFGLFSADPAAEDESFGLFRTDPAAEDESFGLFEGDPVGTRDGSAVPGADTPAATMSAGPAKTTSATGKGGAVAKGAATRARAGTEGENSIRVNIEKVDLLINLVGELVITQSMLAEGMAALDPALHEALLKSTAQLMRNTRDLQEATMSMRMIPMSAVFSRFQRMVRDLSGQLEKKVELKISGEQTELDKTLVEKLTDPLTHLVRNSIDHGIESPARRLALGKAETGRVRLHACHQGGAIVIEVEDDGAGLDRDRILSKAAERGISIDPQAPDSAVWDLIFAPGFSTAAAVTDVSGRGVGMDVVKRNIQALGGRIEIHSTLGAGMRITIRLPLTLAILDGMSVSVGEEVFVVPLAAVSESLQPKRSALRTIGGSGEVVEVRGAYLPVIKLYELFNIPAINRSADEGVLVLLDDGKQRVALCVDALIGQQQFVIKSLETNFRRTEGLSGATILGDGRVAFILDTDALVQRALSH